MNPVTETLASPITTSFTTTSRNTDGDFVEVVMQTTISYHIKATDPLTEFVTTITYDNGSVSIISKNVYDEVVLVTEFDDDGTPTTTGYGHVLASAQTMTLRDGFGHVTATVEYYDVEETTTLYDANHIATATLTTVVPETEVWSTFYDSHGVATKTAIYLRPLSTSSRSAVTPTPSSGPNDQRTLKLRRLPDEIYFAGLMLPTLIAILVSIPIRILGRTVTLYHGFHMLSSGRGASASESLCLKTMGPVSFLDGLRSLRSGSYLMGLTSALIVLSALAIPFSTEVFRLVLQGPQCHPRETNELKCSVALGIFPTPAHVLSALLISLTFGITLVALLLRGWKTGVRCNPWSISSMMLLAGDAEMRTILDQMRLKCNFGQKIGTKEFVDRLGTKTLGLRERDEDGVTRYDIIVLTQEVGGVNEKPVKKADKTVAFAKQGRMCGSSPDLVPFFILTWTGRALFLLLLSGILITVLAYDIVARGSEYQRGLMGKAVGIRFLLSGAGVIVTFIWGSFFNGKTLLHYESTFQLRDVPTNTYVIAVAFISPYRLLAQRRAKIGQAINIIPATNPFTGLWVAFIPLRRDVYLGVVAATAILSEALPLFLGNIPCNGVQVESAETISVYLSVAVLSIMMVIIGTSFFIDWPSMDVDPSTIAGAMYKALAVEKSLGRSFRKGRRDSV